MLQATAEGTLRLPALATAHSHAFQRALRGQAQRPAVAGADDFWSWRGRMYALASSLTPESIHAISLVAYRELARAGVRTVGEFHYVHHRPDGAPYADRTVMADAVIRAPPRKPAFGSPLLRAAYHRRRASVRPARLGAATLLRSRRGGRGPRRRRGAARPLVGAIPTCVIGLAPHSTRAVPPAWLAGPRLVRGAARDPAPHARRRAASAEIDECVADDLGAARSSSSPSAGP